MFQSSVSRKWGSRLMNCNLILEDKVFQSSVSRKWGSRHKKRRGLKDKNIEVSVLCFEEVGVAT